MFPVLLFSQSAAVLTEISKVVVFRSGAQIHRIADVSLSQGVNEIVLTNLPAGFDVSSVNIGFEDKVIIQSVVYRNNFDKKFTNNQEYEKLLAQKQNLIVKIENENMIKETREEELTLITNYKLFQSEQSGFSVAQMKDISDFVRTRVMEVKTNLLENTRKIDSFESELEKLNAQINEWNSKNQTINTGEVVVLALASKNMTSKINLSYFDQRASWYSGFDLRVDNLKDPMSLNTKGNIFQITGEDWKNVMVFLTTANPSVSTESPQLLTWFLRYFESQYLSQNNRVQKTLTGTQVNVRGSRQEEETTHFMDAVQVGLVVPEWRENLTFSEYALPAKMTFLSGNNATEVSLVENVVTASFEYVAIPKLDNKVYLTALIPDWEQYNFSSGQGKLYFEGTYVGVAHLNPIDAEDTLAISLGPDIAVNTKREKLKDFSKTSFLSSKKEISSGYELSVKNNKNVEVELTLKDQIPVSTETGMEIEATELSGGTLDKNTGIVEWNIRLKPGELVKKTMTYVVKIPKDKSVKL
jgi:uncharacterized protein (TIGR02231 family)